MITAWRIFLYSWKNFSRNAWIGLATVFIFMLSLLSVNVLLGVDAMVGRVVALLENKIDVTLTFKPATPDAIVNQARFFLTSLPQVSSVQIVSADDALAAFKARHQNEPKVLAALTEVGGNPLGAQLVLKARNTEDYPFLMQAIQNPQYTDFIQSKSYDDHSSAISKLQEIGRNVRIVGAALVALFALFGLLIAFNAIRVAIYTQREEIAIMRLVGASSAFIRSPFILEGIWLAVLAVLFTAAIMIFSLSWLEPLLMPLFDGQDTGLSTFFFSNWPLIALIEGGGLVFLVIIVSWIAVGRYIHR